ncbi:unnamed protein product [Chrysodeixis includens]|uniref:Uncharacterized protein n=1 Tax=Chrysodeixis includens TaxID=689277 RepID=A0A9N8KWP4_CHRIL|nr:unnamed protein product [Chrysodeixis includens]
MIAQLWLLNNSTLLRGDVQATCRRRAGDVRATCGRRAGDARATCERRARSARTPHGRRALALHHVSCRAFTLINRTKIPNQLRPELGATETITATRCRSAGSCGLLLMTHVSSACAAPHRFPADRGPRSPSSALLYCGCCCCHKR